MLTRTLYTLGRSCGRLMAVATPWFYAAATKGSIRQHCDACSKQRKGWKGGRQPRRVLARQNKDIVHDHYSQVATAETDAEIARRVALEAGYTEEDLALIPPEASLGLGCGNSVRAAALKLGDKVLDLGCGAGMDLFLAGARVGPTGLAVGVDFSAEMVKRGQEIAKKYQRLNVQFHQSSIEVLPFPADVYDVVISNCVLNLVPQKQKAFEEIYRVLKPGGRLVVSDIVLKKPLPSELAKDVAAIVGCVGRAVESPTYQKALEAAGFKNVSVVDMKKDIKKIYMEYKNTVNICACGTSCHDTSVLAKYALNDYIMSCIVKAEKL